VRKSSYDRTSGKLIRLINDPGQTSAMSVGPGGLVWLTDGAGGGGQAGVWLLSADLRQRSVDTLIEPLSVVPASRTTAWAPGQDGLYTVTMPVPGQPGKASQHLDHGTSIGPPPNTAPRAWAGRFDGQVAVEVTNGYGYDSHLVIAGRPSLRFGGKLSQQVGSVASAGQMLWAQTFAIRNGYAEPSGQLVRLDSRLRDTTPGAILRNPVLAKTESVWATGNTVWVATAARRHSLVCFTAGNPMGPVTTVLASGDVVAVASASDTVYVSTQSADAYGPSAVTAYRVPAACQ
jgi:hypothetical protein